MFSSAGHHSKDERPQPLHRGAHHARRHDPPTRYDRELHLSPAFISEDVPAFVDDCFPSGTLHVGDEIREINGISVANQTVEQLQKMLVGDSRSSDDLTEFRRMF